ncbi:MAG TPA: hypothetical protein VK569_01520 [Bacteroidota bacterium]|nr:hypothetical protein [Bacteroidota bacterium]
MTPLTDSPPVRRRLAVASALALVALLLGGSGLVLSGRPRAENPGARRQAEAAVARALDSLCPLYGIDPRLIRSWKATAAGEPTGRTEARITVPPGFRSLEFNHALALGIAPLGARIVATERSKENSVTMHVVQGGVTLRSLSFVPEPGAVNTHTR